MKRIQLLTKLLLLFLIALSGVFAIMATTATANDDAPQVLQPAILTTPAPDLDAMGLDRAPETVVDDSTFYSKKTSANIHNGANYTLYLQTAQLGAATKIEKLAIAGEITQTHIYAAKTDPDTDNPNRARLEDAMTVTVDKTPAHTAGIRPDELVTKNEQTALYAKIGATPLTDVIGHDWHTTAITAEREQIGILPGAGHTAHQIIK